jgi:hypothetical protein
MWAGHGFGADRGVRPHLLACAPNNWPNTGSGRYSSGADTKYVNLARFWYQVDLVTA